MVNFLKQFEKQNSNYIMQEIHSATQNFLLLMRAVHLPGALV